MNINSNGPEKSENIYSTNTTGPVGETPETSSTLPEDMIMEIFSSTGPSNVSGSNLVDRSWRKKEVESYRHKLAEVKSLATKLADQIKTEFQDKYANAYLGLMDVVIENNPRETLSVKSAAESFAVAFLRMANVVATIPRQDFEKLKLNLSAEDKRVLDSLESAVRLRTWSLNYKKFGPEFMRQEFFNESLELLISSIGAEATAAVLEAWSKQKWLSILIDNQPWPWDQELASALKTVLQGDGKDEGRLLAAYKILTPKDDPQQQLETLLLLIKCQPRIPYLTKAFANLCKLPEAPRKDKEAVDFTDGLKAECAKFIDAVNDPVVINDFLNSLEKRSDFSKIKDVVQLCKQQILKKNAVIEEESGSSSSSSF